MLRVYNNLKNNSQSEFRCEKCGKNFFRKPSDTWRIFCSKKCAPTTQVIKCQTCAKDFTRKRDDTWRIFCSKSCAPQKYNETCKKCGQIFYRKPEETWRVFCSKSCSPEKDGTKCKKCDQIFYRKPEETWRIFCSKSCSPKKDRVNCKKCGNFFYRNCEDAWKFFCSNECYININCLRCGIPFRKNKTSKWDSCCSQECFDLLLLTNKCAQCDMNFLVLASEKWKKFCGRSSCVIINKNMSETLAHDNPTNGTSSKEIVWLENIMQSTGVRIKHIKNGGQVSIPGPYPDSCIKFDGYSEETNTVYEFYGDYWHGNPKIYKPDDINDDAKTTFGELYRKTIEREQYIISKGYKLIKIWEIDFDASLPA